MNINSLMLSIAIFRHHSFLLLGIKRIRLSICCYVIQKSAWHSNQWNTAQAFTYLYRITISDFPIKWQKACKKSRTLILWKNSIGQTMKAIPHYIWSWDTLTTMFTMQRRYAYFCYKMVPIWNCLTRMTWHHLITLFITFRIAPSESRTIDLNMSYL